ncbi:MAG: PRC-barrel domain-containing protein [Acidobacteriota bacterium]
MLFSVSELEGFEIVATDGEIGTVEQVYFDDERWAVRYIVVSTGSWLSGRQVLISPFSVMRVDRKQRRMSVTLTRSQVENSPNIDTQKPVTRQIEANHLDHYGYPYYWGGSFLWGVEDRPVLTSAQSATVAASADSTSGSPTSDGTAAELSLNAEDFHLRSTFEVVGYHIEASDGQIGHVEDFIVDDDSWAIRYLAIDTRNWLPGKKVLVSPLWISSIDWAEGKVHVNLSCDGVKQSPLYDYSKLPSREYEKQLHGHYGQDGYWVSR